VRGELSSGGPIVAYYNRLRAKVAIDPRTRTGALPWAPVSLEVCERHAFVGWRAKPGTGPATAVTRRRGYQS